MTLSGNPWHSLYSVNGNLHAGIKESEMSLIDMQTAPGCGLAPLNRANLRPSPHTKWKSKGMLQISAMGL